MRQTGRMNISDIQTAFEGSYKQDPRDGLSVTPQAGTGDFTVLVRHKDADGTLRGFDVVAQPTEAEEKTAQQVGQDVAEVVERELGYGQLAAAGEDGTFKRIVV